MSRRKSNKQRPTVGIYTLCPRTVVDTSYMRSLATLFLVDGNRTIVGLHTTHTARSALGRSQAIRTFLETPQEWLMWIDSDMTFEPTDYAKLYAAATQGGHKIVTGLCFMFDEGVQSIMPNIFNWSDDPDDLGYKIHLQYERDSAFYCDATGVAFTMIHRSIFEDLEELGYGDNWHFDWHEHPDTGGPMGHDVAFFHLCRTLLDERVWYVSAAKVGHRRTVEIREENFDAMLRSVEALRSIPESERPPLTERQLERLK